MVLVLFFHSWYLPRVITRRKSREFAIAPEEAKRAVWLERVGNKHERTNERTNDDKASSVSASLTNAPHGKTRSLRTAGMR